MYGARRAAAAIPPAVAALVHASVARDLVEPGGAACGAEAAAPPAAREGLDDAMLEAAQVARDDCFATAERLLSSPEFAADMIEAGFRVL